MFLKVNIFDILISFPKKSTGEKGIIKMIFVGLLDIFLRTKMVDFKKRKNSGCSNLKKNRKVVGFPNTELQHYFST